MAEIDDVLTIHVTRMKWKDITGAICILGIQVPGLSIHLYSKILQNILRKGKLKAEMLSNFWVITHNWGIIFHVDSSFRTDRVCFILQVLTTIERIDCGVR